MSHWRAWVNAVRNGMASTLCVKAPRARPPVIDVVLTKACNLRCRFCISYGALGGERWMSFDLYRRIAAELFPTAVEVRFCSGGEPFLYPQFREALALAASYAVTTSVVSNGTLIDEGTVAWLVQDQTLHHLNVSLDGATATTLERIRVGASFAAIVGNLERLRSVQAAAGARYPRLGIRFVAMRSNVAELPGMVELVARLGAQVLTVAYLNATSEIDAAESLYHDPALAVQAFAAARRQARRVGLRLVLPPPLDQQCKPRRCVQPWRMCQIDPDGAIRCCYKSWRQRLGFFQDGFEAVWRGPHYARLRTTMATATPYFPYCRHCSERRGWNEPAAHDARLYQEDYLIRELSALQVPFNQREAESAAAWAAETETKR